MARWKVRKRDGVWVVLDRAGKLRYACKQHHMALSFALIQPKTRSRFWILEPKDMGFETWQQAVEQALNQTDYDDHDENEA